MVVEWESATLLLMVLDLYVCIPLWATIDKTISTSISPLHSPPPLAHSGPPNEINIQFIQPTVCTHAPC